MTSKGVEAITTAVADRDCDTARNVRSYEREHKNRRRRLLDAADRHTGN